MSETKEEESPIKQDYEETFEEKQNKILSFREENDNLRDQLKGLCNYLTKELERKKVKKANNSTEIEDPDKLKKFLDQTIKNNEKQMKYYRKLIDKMQGKEDIDTPPAQKIDTLLVKIKNADDEISVSILKVKELEFQNKILEKEEFDAKNETSFMKNLNLLTTEINALKGKSDKIKKQVKIDEKNFKKQQEFLTKLEIKYQDLCKNLNINQELDKIKEEIEENNKRNLHQLQRFNKEIIKNSKQEAPKFLLEDMLRLRTEPIVKKKRYGSVKEYKEDNAEVPDKIDSKNPINAEKSFKNVHSRIITLRKIINNEEKNLQIVLDKYKKQITSLEFETKEIDNKIKEKEKEIIMADDIFKDLKKNSKYNALAPLAFSLTQTKEIKELENFTNKSLIIKNNASRKRKTKRDSYGATLSYDVIFFDDFQAIGSCKNFHLKSITFFLDKKNIILGLQAVYLKNEEIYMGYKNIMEKTLNETELIECTFELADDDYIRNIYGLYVDWIEYLRFETQKGKIFEVGVINEKDNRKNFSLKIRNFDIPVTIFGAIDIRKGGNSNEYVLAAIGVEMKNELSARNEARSKESLTKSQIAKEILNFTNTSDGGNESSVEKKKKKRFFIKKPNNLIKEEKGEKKTTNDEILDKKISQKDKKDVKKIENEQLDNEKKDTTKAKKIQKGANKEKKNDSDDEKVNKIKNLDSNIGKKILNVEEDKKDKGKKKK